MSDAIFRTVTGPPEPQLPTPHGDDPEPNKVGAEVDIPGEPLAGTQAESAILSALGLQDTEGMPDEDGDNLREITGALTALLKDKGVPATAERLARELETLRIDLGIDPEAEPSMVLDKLGGVTQAWKSLAFVRDPREKRQLLMKLARQPDSGSMHRLVFEEMEKRKVWQ